MDEPLDVPDGMQVTSTDDLGHPALEFYTDRFPTKYNVDEVRELADALRHWLDKVSK